MDFRYYRVSIVETQYGCDEILIMEDIITGAVLTYTGRDMDEIIAAYEDWVSSQD